MGRQRNISQMKKEKKLQKTRLNKIETSNLPDAEFKPLVTRILTELRGRADDLIENFNKETENIKMDIKNKKEPVINEEYSN